MKYAYIRGQNSQVNMKKIPRYIAYLGSKSSALSIISVAILCIVGVVLLPSKRMVCVIRLERIFTVLNKTSDQNMRAISTLMIVFVRKTFLLT